MSTKRGLQALLDESKRVTVRLKNVHNVHIQDADKYASEGDVVEVQPASAEALFALGLADAVKAPRKRNKK